MPGQKVDPTQQTGMHLIRIVVQPSDGRSRKHGYLSHRPSYSTAYIQHLQSRPDAVRKAVSLTQYMPLPFIWLPKHRLKSSDLVLWGKPQPQRDVVLMALQAALISTHEDVTQRN